MKQPPCCPVCGLVLPEGRLPGLCPVCAWQAVMNPDEEAGGAAPGGEFSRLRVPGHEVLDELARGGMGIVYRARQFEPRRSVALKMLLPRQLASAEMAERFQLEVRALTELEHPAILPVYQVGECGGLPYFTMKLAAGGTLAQRRSQYQGRWKAIAELMAELADAVQFAHEHGVLHRDLKPGNILFDDQERAYISDFGLAKLADSDTELTRSVDFLGTPSYVAPEVAARSARYATTASDVYSLGAILYELLAGCPPFTAEGMPALLKKIAEEEPTAPSRAGTDAFNRVPKSSTTPVEDAPAQRNEAAESVTAVPRDLEVICLKCLAKEPAQRYGSARELSLDLRRWLAGESIVARPVSPAERAWKWVRRNPQLSGVLGLLLICFLGGGLALWNSDRQVRRALAQARRAERQGQESLADALLAQARALGAAHAAGQRWQALQALAQAARFRPSLELRNEAAATLARPDLREASRFRAVIGPAGSSVVFTSDLQRYIVAEPEGGFSLRATADQKILRRFSGASGRPARWFVLGPHDRMVAALMADYSLEVWKLGGEHPEFTWRGTVEQPPVVEFHPDGVTVAAYVPGQGLFTQRLDGSERRILEPGGGRTLFLRYSPSGERLAVAREPEGIEVWEFGASARTLWRLPLARVVPWLAWSPDGGRLLAAADDGHGLRVLAADTGNVELVYSRHLLYARQFEFDPKAQTVASVGDDWSLRLWDARSGQDLVTGVGRHRALRFSSDGTRLTTAPADDELAVLELAPAQVFREFQGTAPASHVTASGLAATADGRLLLVTQPQLHLYDTQAGVELASLDLAGGLDGSFALFESNRAVVYSTRGQGVYRRELAAETGSGERRVWGGKELVAQPPGGMLVATVESGRTWVWRTESEVSLWPQGDPEKARRLGLPAAISGPRQRLAVSPNARWAALAQPADDSLIIWDCVADCALTNLAATAADRVWFSPDSEWLVASAATGYRTWSTLDWHPGRSWTAKLDSGDPGEVAFSADSRLVAARHERETFCVLSFPDCRELVTLKPPLALPVRNACLRADGKRLWLLTSSFRVFEWDLDKLQAGLVQLGLDWNPLPSTSEIETAKFQAGAQTDR